MLNKTSSAGAIFSIDNNFWIVLPNTFGYLWGGWRTRAFHLFMPYLCTFGTFSCSHEQILIFLKYVFKSHALAFCFHFNNLR